MRLVLAAECIELHAQECFERHDRVIVGGHGFAHVGRRQWIRLPNLLAREQKMDCVARAAVGAVDEADDVRYRPLHEACCFEGHCDGRQVAAAHEEVDVLRVPHGRTIHSCHSRSHGVAAGHGVGDSSFLERRGSPQCPVTNGLHSFDHALPGKLAQFDSHEMAPSQHSRAPFTPGIHSSLHSTGKW